MANLAIKGHPTRGEEVIKILEMLGGVNKHHRKGNIPSWCYYIGHLTYIYGNSDVLNEYLTFTLEEFIEKFPYKVGDKVKYINNIFDIKSSQWDSEKNTVIYYIDADWSAGYVVETDNLQPYKEETMDKVNKAVFDANAQCCDIMNHLIKEETIEQCKSVMTAKKLIDRIKDINIISHDIPIYVDMKEVKSIDLIGNEKYGAAILISTQEGIKIGQHESTKM